MRLEHDHHAAGVHVARGGERRRDLAGMMAVVIHDGVVFAAMLELEAAARAAKSFQRRASRRESARRVPSPAR